MTLYLSRVLATRTTPAKILHVAPDFGLHLWLQRQKNVVTTACDIDTKRYRHIPDVVAADLTNIPFSDETFDLVLCSHVLEHIPDDRKAMAEILRVLRPGGQALLLVPFALDGAGTDEDVALSDPQEQERRFGQWDHVRLYDRDDFLQRLRAVGFDVDLFAPCRTEPDTAKSMWLNPLEDLPIASRPATGASTV